jgi:pyruvate ferredoxin oxidoreductase alpha subunit
LEINEGKRSDHTSWIDVKDNAMDIREVLKVV